MSDKLPPPTIEELAEQLSFIEDVLFEERARNFAFKVILIEFLFIMKRAKVLDPDSFVDALRKVPLEGVNASFQFVYRSCLDELAQRLSKNDDQKEGPSRRH